MGTLSLSAAQGFFGLQAHPNGALTPIDEPRVAALKADHLATKFGAGPIVAAGPVGYVAAPVAHVGYAAGPVVAAAPARADHFAAQGAAFAAAGPVVAAAPVVAAGPVAAVGYAGAYAPGYGYAGPLNLNTHLVAHPNGAVVPADEPAVAAARADHFAAQGAAYAAAGPVVAGPVAVGGVYAHAAPVAYGYGGPLNLNTHLVAHPNGAVVPVDEPAVAAAR